METLAGQPLPPARRAVVRKLIDPYTNIPLDDALVLWLPAPGTVTGEDVVELHLHGGRAVVRATLDCLEKLEGLEAAEAGAFTRRAFDNGRIDLPQVEGLADLLAAETESQRQSALAMAEGALGQLAASWRKQLLRIAAQVEAQLDFADEDDVTLVIDDTDLAGLRAEIAVWLAAPSAERLRDGVRIVLAGPPNAGKSTLLNALVGREAAIVSPIAGTTRDIVEVPVLLDGIPFVFTDTAGLHIATHDEIEVEGMRRARVALTQADIILWLGASQDCPDRDRSIMIAARADEFGPVDALIPDQHAVSVKTGEGLETLRGIIKARAFHLLPPSGALAINRRQRDLIVSLHQQLTATSNVSDFLIRAEHLRLARGALDRLVGHVGVEDMLDALFSGFCIGK